MDELTDKKLLNLITYAPATIVGAFFLFWMVLSVTDLVISSKEELLEFQEEYQQRQNTILTKQVEYVAQQVKFARLQTEHQLENTIQNRIHEAHKIATRLYESNKHLPEEQVTKIITDALRVMRFNEGRGYFFIYKMNGINVMHPLLPQVEGTSLWDYQDSLGNYIVRDMGKDVKKHGEAFYRWWFVKPDNKEKQFEKIGFGQYFEPYDWYIGTGDYVVDVENDIKKTVLKWIKNLRFGEFGYVLVLDADGTVLSHINSDVIGKKALELVSPDQVKSTKQLLNANNTFVEYHDIYQPDTVSDNTKTSYVIKESSWDWSISAGVYNERSDRVLAQRQAKMEEEQHRAIIQMIIIGSAATLIVALCSLALSKVIAKRFTRFQARINTNFHQLQDAKDKLEYLARHDELTGLPNRSLLHEQISQGIKNSARNCQMLAVMFVDLDDFKKVNDVYGHTAGDQLLTEIGKKFESFLEPGEFVARFGGDEFIFCFPYLTSLTAASNKVEQIKNVFQSQFTLEGKILHASCSIGVSMFPTDGYEPEDLISKADIVLYKSKARQKGDVLFYDSAINQQVQHDFLLEHELRHAIERGELSVAYQPQIEAKTGKLYGVEALIRWHNPQLGHVSPFEFIALAEEIGLVDQLGEFVLHRACDDIGRLFPTSQSDLRLSVNISPMQLMSANFVPHLQSVVAQHNLPSSRITLEITENVLINDLPKVTPIIARLKELGFAISLDDFGTGYSSLSYLNTLSLDELKIDRSFVDKMLSSEQSNSLVKAILAIAESSDMMVVAEGVETDVQQQILIDYGCDFLQGYLIDKPLPIEQLNEKYAVKYLELEEI
ncbi:bifunctional diguanylate cyclase/phosphodiesterase [Vibrio nereis]|uniref:bifunctional diguanylate cyclase/phosphodiesterase n=1 Tax=Vibrio nereis TaxID=693 RepID=UPI0024958DD7|nr:cache domain-containing protein [Vibrio nereis]